MVRRIKRLRSDDSNTELPGRRQGPSGVRSQRSGQAVHHSITTQHVGGPAMGDVTFEPSPDTTCSPQDTQLFSFANSRQYTTQHAKPVPAPITFTDPFNDPARYDLSFETHTHSHVTQFSSNNRQNLHGAGNGIYREPQRPHQPDPNAVNNPPSYPSRFLEGFDLNHGAAMSRFSSSDTYGSSLTGPTISPWIGTMQHGEYDDYAIFDEQLTMLETNDDGLHDEELDRISLEGPDTPIYSLGDPTEFPDLFLTKVNAIDISVTSDPSQNQLSVANIEVLSSSRTFLDASMTATDYNEQASSITDDDSPVLYTPSPANTSSLSDFFESASPSHASEPPFDCDFCTVATFRNRAEYNKHLLRHTKPFKCPISDCSRSTTGFSTRNDLDRHCKSCHRIAPKTTTDRSFRCAGPSCAHKTKVWPRLDNFRQHCQRCHKDIPLDELVEASEVDFTIVGLR